MMKEQINKPKFLKNTISVVVPVYNSEKYLVNCIESILNQNEKNIELILVDDGSTDSSRLICEKYCSFDKRVKYYYQNNKGVSFSRNLGVKLSHGEYIMFVDSDDMLLDNSVQDLLLSIKDADFAFGSYVRFYTNMREELFSIKNFYGSKIEFTEIVPYYIKKLSLQSPWGKLYKSEIIKKNNLVFPHDMNYGEDTYFVFEYLQNVKSVKSIDNVVYKYRVNDNGLCYGFKEIKYLTNLMLNKKIYNYCNDVIDQYCNNKWLVNMNHNAFYNYANDCAAENSTKSYDAFIYACKYSYSHLIFERNTNDSFKSKLVYILLSYKLYWLLYFVFRLNYIKHFHEYNRRKQ